MAKQTVEKKMTLDDYQQKYRHPENIKAARSLLAVLGLAIGIVIATCLFFIVLRLFEIHVIAGYVGIFFAIIIFIFAYVVPLVKLNSLKSFMTNFDSSDARRAQKYNKQLREEIADKMIDVNAKTEGVGWYSDKLLGKLAVARHTKNDKELKSVLTEIYKSDVKKAANKMIAKSAFNTGLITAVSQSEVVDTLTVLVSQLNLIKNIVFLYGFRPSETQMVKIYKNVLINSLAAYGATSVTRPIGKAIGTTISGIAGVLTGGIASSLIEASLQAGINSALTTYIGAQTKMYLIREYNLQAVLDNVKLIDEEEEAKQIEEIKAEVNEKLSKKLKQKKQKIED